MARHQKHSLPVDGSWRMVEGEHDSFDTSVVPNDDAFHSSGNSQFSAGDTQETLSFRASQDDDLEAYMERADEDDRFILRSPFRPSVPYTAKPELQADTKALSRGNEFRMPRVAVDITASPPRQAAGLRNRGLPHKGSQPQRRSSPRRRPTQALQQQHYREPGRVWQSVEAALLDSTAWLIRGVGMAFRYAQKPLAFLLAIWLSFGGLIIAQNMLTKSLYTALSPVCRIPGASYLDLPFCPAAAPGDTNDDSQPVEFRGLMDVQSSFEKVMEKSVEVVSLPVEMKRSELAVRDLRTMVRISDLRDADLMVEEFNGFIEEIGKAIHQLSRFNTRVGGAADRIISINTWTSRYIERLEEKQQSEGILTGVTSWLFTPFAPLTHSEQDLLDIYIRHTTDVSDKINSLISEADEVLQRLHRAEGHLDEIHQHVTREARDVKAAKDEILWTLWGFLTMGGKESRKMDNQLLLLKQVNNQRTTAVQRLTELIFGLQEISAGLEQLTDTISEPRLYAATGKAAKLPLAVHVETINQGVLRLQHARSRIRAEEEERYAAAIKRGPPDERLLGMSASA